MAMRMRNVVCSLILALGCLAPPLPAAWAPVPGEIMTPWASKVDPAKPLPEYPRPQMVRKEWQNLNGLWDYAITSKTQERAGDFQGQILVPFPVQSALSGVKKTLTPENRLWYRRTFTVPESWGDKRVLLHFGAVDWDATVWVNGKELGKHQGGYDPFSFDITSALKKGAEQEIMLAIWDPNNSDVIPRGKQVLQPRGIYYTAVSGIWQTVWLEVVPQAHIAALKVTPDLDAKSVRLVATVEGGQPSDQIEVAVKDAGKVVATGKGSAGQGIAIAIDNPKLWEAAPAEPFLYDLTVTLQGANDSVESYFGMRKIEVKKDEQGVNRLFLNNKPLFQYGPLDQGWWPDGLYTAPTDEALKFDIDETIKMGFNMARKHVKVEPERWYYWADKLGLIVWQDMPSGDKGIRPNQPDIERDARSKEIYEREYTRMIESHYSHPSIVMWVPFNEGWGQFDTARIVEMTKKLDPTRLVDNASGWSDRGVGDVYDMHKYPGPGMFPVEEKRASVLGEFGGLGLPVEGHLWVIGRRWGYRDMKDAAELTQRYTELVDAMKPLIAHGLSAAVYTQTTDCEGEVNGLLTYDRAVNKIGVDQIAKINRGVYGIKTDLSKPLPQDSTPEALRAKTPAPKGKKKKQ